MNPGEAELHHLRLVNDYIHPTCPSGGFHGIESLNLINSHLSAFIITFPFRKLGNFGHLSVFAIIFRVSQRM